MISLTLFANAIGKGVNSSTPVHLLQSHPNIPVHHLLIIYPSADLNTLWCFACIEMLDRTVTMKWNMAIIASVDFFEWHYWLTTSNLVRC